MEKKTTTWRTTPLPPNWNDIRLGILIRDGYQCQQPRHRGARCPNPANEVDHIIPAALGGSDKPDNLRAICRLCHGRKTQAEGQLAKETRGKRPKEQHPFLL